MGGTMRLGADPIKLHPNTRAREIYGEAVIYERHRHRYEVNNFLRKRIEAAGLVCSGTSPDERLVEIIEIPDHPFFVASQYHPEFKSRPERPAPLFRDFVAAALRAQKAAAPGGDRRRRAGRGPVRPASEAEKTRQGELFAELCRIPSPSWEEAACAERVTAELRGMGLEVAARRGRQPAGARARAVRADRPAVRAPGHGAAGRADRARAGRRRLGERERRHPRRRQQVRGGDDPRRSRAAARVEGSPVGLELLFTVAEEIGLLGRQALRRVASCAPSSATSSTTRPPIGELVTASPTLYRVEAEFHGKSAHAGLRPEDGHSAILAAAHAAIAMPHGRIDQQTTANIGYLHGGVESTNVVPGARPPVRRGPLGRRRQGRGGPGRDDRRPAGRRQPRRVRRRRDHREAGRRLQGQAVLAGRGGRRGGAARPRLRAEADRHRRRVGRERPRGGRASRRSTWPTAPSTTTSRPSASPSPRWTRCSTWPSPSSTKRRWHEFQIRAHRLGDAVRRQVHLRPARHVPPRGR